MPVSRHVFLLLTADQGFTGTENVARAHGDHNVPLPDVLPQIGGDVWQGLAVHRTGDLLRQLGGGNADGVPFPGGVDLRQDGLVRQGSSTVNVLPTPIVESTVITPFIFSTMDLQMESPNPAPWAKESTFSNRSNIIPSFSGGIPHPVSETLILIPSVSVS